MPLAQGAPGAAEEALTHGAVDSVRSLVSRRGRVSPVVRAGAAQVVISALAGASAGARMEAARGGAFRILAAHLHERGDVKTESSGDNDVELSVAQHAARAVAAVAGGSGWEINMGNAGLAVEPLSHCCAPARRPRAPPPRRR